MIAIKCVILWLMLKLSFVHSQFFKIGILDQDIFSFLQNQTYQNFTVTYITLPNIDHFENYALATNILNGYDVIVGRFNYTVATICQQIGLTYFYLNDRVETFPGVLLEMTNDLATQAQLLMFYLNKYNINRPIRFIGDGSLDSINFRYGLSESTVSQCNFNPNDNDTTINQCYQTVFKGNTISNYIFISDGANTAMLDKLIQQSLYMSLPYSSMMFIPVIDITPILKKYYYVGGVFFELTQDIVTSNPIGTLIQRYGVAALAQIVASLSSYMKINESHWTRNGVISPFDKSIILKTIKTTRNFYQTSGQKSSKTIYIYTLYNGLSVVKVSFFTYIGSWVESTGVPNPATTGAKGFIQVIYVPDPVFISEVNTTAGSVLQGYFLELFNNLISPIQLSYVPSKYTVQPIIGRLVNNSFTGMLGPMSQNLFAMTIYPVPIFQEYRRQLTYSDRILDTQYSMLIRKANKTVQYLKLVQPFSPLVWIFILVTIIFLSFILWLTNMISPNMSDGSDNLTINNSTFMVFGSFLIAKMLVKPNMFSTQIFYLLIWLGTLLIIASYVSSLVFQITFTNTTKIQFTTLQSLLDNKNYKWAFVNNSYLYNRIKLDQDNNSNSTYQKLYEYANITWPDRLIVEQENVETFVLNNADFGILNDAIHNMKISLQNCLLTTVIDKTETISLAFVMSSTFQFFQEFSKQILLTRENGILDILETRYFKTGKCPVDAQGGTEISFFNYEDTCGIFILILFGIVISLVVAAIEFMLSKCTLQCQRVVSGNSLQFGKVYKAKVKTLDKDGVTVDIGRQSCFSRKDDGRIYYVHKKFLGHRPKNSTDIPSPTEQGIMIGTTLLLKYLGNSPDDSKRKFVQVTKK